MAGSEADGFGSAGDMTTAFALEKSMFSSGMLSFNGNIGANAGDPTGVLRASYSHDFGESSRPTFTITYRHFAVPGATVENSPYSAVDINSSDKMSVAGIVDLQYGADLQSLGVCPAGHRCPSSRRGSDCICRPIWWWNIATPPLSRIRAQPRALILLRPI